MARRLGQTKVVAIGLVVALVSVGGCSQGAAVSGSSGSPTSAGLATPTTATVPSTSGPSQPTSAEPPPGLIAFDRFDGVRGVEGTHLGTFIAHPDGSEERRLSVSAKVDASNPVWSPDRSMLLLSAFILPDGPGRPAIVDADGSGFHLLEPSGLAGDLACSAWSSDGTALLCSVGSGTHPEIDGIYAMRSDGTGLTRLTVSPFHDTVGSSGECGGGEGRGTYSPDGTKIIYIRQKCGSGPDPSSDESAAIELIGSDGTGSREIVAQGRVRSHPGSQISWSPDGTQIVLGSQDGDLFLVHPDGTALTKIPLPAEIGSFAAYGPRWSPDGSRIVFSMYVASSDSSDLYIIAPDGTDLRKVTDAAGVEGYADWTGAP